MEYRPRFAQTLSEKIGPSVWYVVSATYGEMVEMVVTVGFREPLGV